MCGILMYLSAAEHRFAADHPSLESIKHRGPDGFGFRTFSCANLNLTLGHRRLSILDLSDRAAQPMQYAGSRIWITFNGEVYNYLELKEELQGFGYIFNTTSDTEVILAAYHKWRDKCLDKLNGMFAFCIWDDEKKVLFGARDRFGVKPLYYWNSPSGFTVVSEIKQLLSFAGFQPTLDYNAAYQYLAWGDYCIDRQTMWNGVYELEPGCMFHLDLNKWKPGHSLNQIKWYDIDQCFKLNIVSEKEAIDNLYYLLKDSVKIRLRSDVPVGIMLSGGIDSSSITCIAAGLRNGSDLLQTFSAYFNERNCNEKEYFDEVINSTDVKPNILLIRPADAFDMFDKTIWHHDMPTTGRSIFAQYLLYKDINSKNTKVVLEGQGADEILAGYRGFFWALMSEFLLHGNLPDFLREYVSYKKSYHSNFVTDLKEIARSIFAKKIIQKQKGDKDKFFIFDEQFNQNHNDHKNYRLSNSFMKFHYYRMINLRSILYNVDRGSMAYSVEIRLPYMDYRLVEFCLSLPFNLKIKNSVSKYVLREAMKNILPRKIFNRKDKMGFPSPEEQWAKNELKDLYMEYLKKIKHIPFLNEVEIEKKFNSFLDGKEKYDDFFWRVISFNRWVEMFNITI